MADMKTTMGKRSLKTLVYGEHLHFENGAPVGGGGGGDKESFFWH